ncbi:hypothetical protein BSKO_12213 [Bryopsis sp. KO-2023]|nr:hypothetical protein BSKO_12213 [Bryopsis sp. KO-2023]
MWRGLQLSSSAIHGHHPMDVNAWSSAIPSAVTSALPDAPAGMDGRGRLGGFSAPDQGFLLRGPTPYCGGTLVPVCHGDARSSPWGCQPYPAANPATQSCLAGGAERSDHLHGLTRRLGRDRDDMMPTLGSGEAHPMDAMHWGGNPTDIAPIPVEYRKFGRGLKNEWQIPRLLPRSVSSGVPRIPTHHRSCSDWDKGLHPDPSFQYDMEGIQQPYPIGFPMSGQIACQLSGNLNAAGSSMLPMMEMTSCPAARFPEPTPFASIPQTSSPTHMTRMESGLGGAFTSHPQNQAKLGSGEGFESPQQDSDSEFDLGDSHADPLDELLDMLVDDTRSGTDIEASSKDAQDELCGGLESQGSWSGVQMSSQAPLTPMLFPASFASSPVSPRPPSLKTDGRNPCLPEAKSKLTGVPEGRELGCLKVEQEDLGPVRARSVDAKGASTPVSDESSTSVAVGCSPRAVSTTAGASPQAGRRLRVKTSEHTGVSKHRKSGRWEVHIWVGSLGKQVYLGGYDDADAAAEAYDIVQIRTRGEDAKTNFPKARYKDVMEFISSKSLPELIAHIRRGSKGFSRGISEYRGVTLNPNGRWEARIGAYGSRHVYLGLYAPQKEAAIHYDTALVRLRGHNAATNFALSNYERALEEHQKLVEAYGDNCVSSLGRIPSLKTKFEHFLKSGGRELDSLIGAIKRLDSRERPCLPKMITRKKQPGQKATKVGIQGGKRKKEEQIE